MAEFPNGELCSLPITSIDEPENPMRSSIDAVGISELSDSIRVSGLINPITVRPNGDRYTVVAGHRRLLACRLAGLAAISCVVRELDEQDVVGIMGTENLERSDTDPVDDALFVGRYIGEDEGKIPELARKLNRSVAWVRGRLDMLAYDADLLSAIRRGDIKLGVAAWLARVENDMIRAMWIRDAAAHGWTMLQAEHQYNLWKSGALDNVLDPPPPPDGAEVAQVVHASATCEKCGRRAVEPNMRSVFIHVECPAEPAAEPSIPADPPPKSV